MSYYREVLAFPREIVTSITRFPTRKHGHTFSVVKNCEKDIKNDYCRINQNLQTRRPACEPHLKKNLFQPFSCTTPVTIYGWVTTVVLNIPKDTSLSMSRRENTGITGKVTFNCLFICLFCLCSKLFVQKTIITLKQQ